MAAALHDFECPRCLVVLRDVPIDMAVGAVAGAPLCPHCTGEDPPVEVRLQWIPKVGRMSAGGGPTFRAFEVHGPDGKLKRINSITELRHMERESEKMARDGVGEGQMVWRDLSNDRSNKYDHAINKDWEPKDYPGTPSKADLAKWRAVPAPPAEIP